MPRVTVQKQYILSKYKMHIFPTCDLFAYSIGIHYRTFDGWHLINDRQHFFYEYRTGKWIFDLYDWDEDFEEKY